ncbi:MAG: peptidase E [bacterium]
MPAEQPTILATSGGIVPGRRTRYEVGPLTDFAIELSGVSGRAPRVCYLGTAGGDNPAGITDFYNAARLRGLEPSHLQLFLMPNVDDMRSLLLEQDVVWVFGGSVAGLLALWRVHGVDALMRQAWQAGVVLTGVSAGSICWHTGGPTDSFGPELQVIDNGLALVPFSAAVHYDSEPQRRPLFQAAVADGRLGTGYATDDGTGVLYRGTQFAGAYGERDGKGVYLVERNPNGTATETALEVTRLP